MVPGLRWRDKSNVVIIIIMESDDTPVGRVLSRREIVALLGLSGVALLTSRAFAQSSGSGGAVPRCVVRPQQTEGPFFVDEKLERSDIRSDPGGGEPRPGTPLQVAFNVSTLSGGACAPLAGARVDVWHCDALGAYSDGSRQRFLRGYQTTDAAGLARFTTVFPGGYQGRAVHIHFKIRTTQRQEFTSQLYFDDALTDRVHAQPPYPGAGQRRMRNESDGLFRNGGRQLVLAVSPSGSGYTGAFDIALGA
jgi:protocatechuate 3,4-dioxygenase beta subunit